MTVGDTVSIPNIGAKSLLGLLTALEAVALPGNAGRGLVRKSDPGRIRAVDGEAIREVTMGAVTSAERMLLSKGVLPKCIRTRTLPALPFDATLDDLEGLDVRTYNALARRGLAKRPLAYMPVGDVLSASNFGARGLFQLLVAIEAAQLRLRAPPPLTRRAAQAQPQPDQDLTFEAEALLRMQESRHVRSDDPRLGGLVRSIAHGEETLYDAAHRLSRRSRDPVESELVLRQLRDVQERLLAVSRLSLEDELIDVLNASVGERDGRVFARRMGWDGRGGATLERVGGEAGLTRERVRQVCNRARNRLSRTRPFAPILDRALRLVMENAPRWAGAIEALAVEGLTRRRFPLDDLLKAAEVLGRDVAVIVQTVGEERFVVSRDTGNSGRHMSELAKSIVRVARRSVEHWGATTVADVEAQVPETSALSTDFALEVLKARQGFRWLDEESGWFWLPSVPRNRLLNRIEKVLSVTQRVPVSDLRSAVARHYRMKGFAPPRRVLLELCRQLPQYRVDNDVVIADSILDWAEVLAETEATMALVLKELGPVMTRAKLEEECLGLGMNRSTFYVHLDNSPIISRYARGVYGLVGAVVPPDVVESLIRRPRRSRVLVDYGWISDARVWLAYRLSESMFKSGVFGVSAGMKQVIQGEFSLKTDDGSRVGTLVSRENAAWGLGPFFRRRGGEPGDYLLIVFDLQARHAVATIGDEGLLDEFQAAEEEAAAGPA